MLIQAEHVVSLQMLFHVSRRQPLHPPRRLPPRNLRMGHLPLTLPPTQMERFQTRHLHAKAQEIRK